MCMCDTHSTFGSSTGVERQRQGDGSAKKSGCNTLTLLLYPTTTGKMMSWGIVVAWAPTNQPTNTPRMRDSKAATRYRSSTAGQ